uniref:Uncharacterized protein n=1 Tax=Castor canadensis TaxID=51338 RepID=A0A8C0ZW54_CASCN|nr:melanoma inhibitory activity protein 3 isoform X1 [Castor canadensis]
MAAAPVLFVWLLVLWLPWGVPSPPDPSTKRRFSEQKICADEECSLLMYRGEALEDFTGPDCRFVNFKKGDPVYVYYKLTGGSPQVWAGSVGRIFGYFPKDLIKVLHEYTKEELQVPTDETDFVCFDGGRDEFNNYNVKELLGFLKLYDSATDHSDKGIEKVSQGVEKPPDISEESEPEPELGDANSEERESAFLESTKELEEQYLALKSQFHESTQADNAQEEYYAFDPFEEMLQDKLQVPESENKTSNISQVSNGQKIDTYKLLKTEMTLDLETKFGSTADALVSDDETTKLVTSLEDDFEEDLDPQYYVVENEKEENTDNSDELSLLTFMDGENVKTPMKYGIEKQSTDKEQNSDEGDTVEVTLPPEIKNDDKNILTTLEDTFFSVVTGSDEKAGMMNSEISNSEKEKEDDDVLVPDSKQGRPQLAMGYVDPENAEDGLSVDVSKTNDDFEMDTEVDIKGKGEDIQESKQGLVQDESELVGVKLEGAAHSSPQNNKLILPAAKKEKHTLKAASKNKENDLKEAIIHISKETLHEEKSGEQLLDNSSESKSLHKGMRSQMTEEKNNQETLGVTPLLRENNASKDRTEEVGVSVSGPKAHIHSMENQHHVFKVKQDLKTQNQPRFSSSGDVGLSRKLEEKVPVLGRNISWQQESDVAVTVNKQVNEKIGLSEEEGTENPADAQLAYHQATQGTQEVEKTEQSDSMEVSHFHTEKPEADEDDYPSEELLEDENALSAERFKETHLGIQNKRSDVNLQVSEEVISVTVKPEPETERKKQETNMIVEIEKTSDTTSKGADRMGRESDNVVVGRKESPLADEKAQRPSEVSVFPDKKIVQTPKLGEVFQHKDPDDLEKDSHEEHLNTSGLVKKPGEEEISNEDPEGIEKLMGTDSQGPAPEDPEDDLLHWSPPIALEPELSGLREDLPIICSFFKEQHSLQRFLKYFDVHELEAMLHEMSLKLKSAQQESLPYNVEKVLDKVFRASESQILSVAEKMLDTRVTQSKDPGVKENSISEEVAVLDDIQDLIYFVRYKHSMVEETAPLITAPPPEERWAGAMEEVQLPQEDNFQQENTDLNIQPPEEPDLLDQPVTGNMDFSEVSQKLNTEKEIDPGLFATEDNPVDEQPEIRMEKPASASPSENTTFLVHSFVLYLTEKLVATLPEHVQPGPDFYGLPWKPVILTIFLGMASFYLFFWRVFVFIKDKLYEVSELHIYEKMKIFRTENSSLKQKLSNYDQERKNSNKHVQETKKQNTILHDETIKYKDKVKELEETNRILREKAKSLHIMLESQREQNIKTQDMIMKKDRFLEKLKDAISTNTSEFSKVQIALNEAKLSEEKVKSEYHRVQDENAKLKKKKDELEQHITELRKSHVGLSEQIKSFEKSQNDLKITVTHKDDNIKNLTNCLIQLNQLENEYEDQKENKSDEFANGELCGDRNEKIKNQIKQMMDVSRTQTAMSAIEEDLKVVQQKLGDSLSTKCDLQDQIKKLEDDYNTLKSSKDGLEDKCKTLKQKVEILNELYQQKEMALQKKLSQEEYDRREKENQLLAADEKMVVATEEVKTYKRRIEEIEEELEKTERSFKNQIVSHEKKAHDNWIKARAAERAILEEKREAANLRHKLLEISQKMAVRQDEPVIVKPMPRSRKPPRRARMNQNGSFDPSPVSGGECSPPSAEPSGRARSATFTGKDMPTSEFNPGSDSAPMMNNSSRSSTPSKVVDEGKVNMAPKVPPPFPGVPLMGSPVGGPLPPSIRYGPPPQLCGPFGPRPLPPPFVPGMRPPLSLREYAPGVPPGKRDLPLDPRDFLQGHTPFRPLVSLGPREYFITGARLPPPTHGPQDYLPQPAARESLPSGSRDKTPPISQSNIQDCSQALKQSP